MIRHFVRAHIQNRRHTAPWPHCSTLPCMRPNWNMARIQTMTLLESLFCICPCSKRYPMHLTRYSLLIPTVSSLSLCDNRLPHVVSVYLSKHPENPLPIQDIQLYSCSLPGARMLGTHTRWPADADEPTIRLGGIAAFRLDTNTNGMPFHGPMHSPNRHTNLKLGNYHRRL